MQVNKSQFSGNEMIEVSFTLKNTGKFDGAEIAQLYISDPESELPRPLKELKGFQKVFLHKGEEKTITISLDQAAFSYYNEDKGGWITEHGKFEILIGSSSDNVRLCEEIEYGN